ncbi:ARM repeat-containing protein [Paxillus ammoniavirescens]|nr:ARM repeat-containing protein [Paxillus ammoniavirescens]
MPRELRKRGKKHKKHNEPGPSDPSLQAQKDHHEKPSEPSWIISVPQAEDAHPEAPFGYVEPDIKAYFRTVDEQIRTWQEDEHQPEMENDDLDPNEAKRLFFVAALNEMSGKEKQLATDPDCSIVLERMAHSMDDFVRRVFIDSLGGSFEALFKHRFASHVCQTLFSVASGSISRETKGILPEVPNAEDKGELRTLTQLVLDICEEIRPSFNSLIMDPFASHVLRSLLLLLCPTVVPGDSSAHKSVRSKKSTSWKIKQGKMKSVFSSDKGKAEDSRPLVPSEFRDTAAQFLRTLKGGLDANEVRALAANKVASPLLQLVLEIEADHGGASLPDSLMDRVLVGMITAYHNDPDISPEASDYLVTLLRDPTSSHLLETLVSRCPGRAFNLIWQTYFRDKLARLAFHPVANFVVAKAVERLDSTQLGDALEELKSSLSKMTKSSRTGVLRALIDRSCTLESHEKDVCEATFAAVGISSPEHRKELVPCVLLLKSLEEYQALPPAGEFLADKDSKKKSGRKGEAENPREPKIQGALILQSLLRLKEPHCSIVVDSISLLSMEDLIGIAHNATSSRVLDAIFESPTVSFKSKRRLTMSFIGHYHTLVDDRIGSRVGDRCWAFADPYLREKVARSLIPYEQFLAASFYGKFFARNLNLYLLQRRPEDWKTLQSNNKANTPKTDQPISQAPSSDKVSKKRSAPEDEIDAVFDAALGNKTKKAAVGHVSAQETKGSTDQQMSEVLGAIHMAPAGQSGRAKKKRKNV